MVEEPIQVVEEEIQEEKNALLESLRRVLLAAVGAVFLAQEEMEDFVNRLVQRGEIAEKDARRLLSDVRERRQRQLEGELDDGRVEQVLHRLNLPSKTEIDALSRQIDELSRRVEELRALER